MDGNNKILIEVRVAAELGNPLNKWENNRMESLNLAIKEQIYNNAAKKKVFGQQLEEVVKGIYRMGKYYLVEELAS